MALLWALFFASSFQVCHHYSDHFGSWSLLTDRDCSGQPYDVETGLYYYQSRYYDPELGRFIQPDSIVPNPGSSQSLSDGNQ